MGTFGSSADFQRPTPRVTSSPAIPAAPDLSTAGADTLYAQGQQTKELAAAADHFGQVMDETAAQDALNQLRTKRQELTLDPQKGVASLKGGDVLKQGPSGKPWLQEFPDQFRQSADDLAGKLISPRAKAMFRDAAAKEQIGFKGDVLRHITGETEKWEDAVFKDTNAVLTNDAVRNIDNPQALDGIVGKMIGATENYLRRKGLPAEASKLDIQSGVYATVISTQIQSGNDQAALAAFSRYGDKLTAADKLKLLPSLETIQRSTSAKEFARNPGAFAGGSGDFDVRLAAGEGGSENGGFVFNKLGSGAYGPFQFMPDTWADVRAKNPGLNLPADMTQATFEQHKAANDAFKAANAESLKADGYEPTAANMYLAHRFGAKGAVRVLSANPATPLEKILPATWFDKNPDLRGRTAGEFIDGAQKRMAGVTTVFGSRPGAPGNIADSRIGDPLATSVNDATAGRPARTLEEAVNIVTSPSARQAATDPGQGVPNARQQMIQIEQERQRAREINYAQFSGNPKTYAANEAAINSLYEQRKASVQLYKDQLWDAVQEHMLRGGKGPDGKPNGTPAMEMPSADIVSQLDFEQVRKLEKQVELNIQGAKPKTDWGLYTDLERGLTHENANVREVFAKMHPMQFRSQLADDQYKSILELQATVRKGDGREISEAVSRSQIIKSTLEVVLGPEPKPTDGTRRKEYANKEAQFNRVLNYEVSAFEKEKGKKADAKEFQDIVDGIIKSAVSGERKGWFGWGSPAEKPLFQFSLADIPRPDRDALAAYLRSVGVAPTDSNILEAYRHAKVIESRKRTVVPYGRGNWQPGVDAAPYTEASPDGGFVQAATMPPSIGGNTFGGNTFGGNTFGGRTFGGNTFGGQTFGESK